MTGELTLEVLERPATLGESGAQVLAAAPRAGVEHRGHATLAVSGGSTPGAMLAALARHPMPWEQVHIVQVDERIAPDGHPDRNLALLHERFLAALIGTAPTIHAMPVTTADPDTAARRYAALLVELAGDPPVLDVVQLGMGSDGHTASLVPDDPILDVGDRDVAVTGPYHDRRRLTCTFPLLSRARQRVWLISGAAKADALARVLAGDRSLPAARVPRRAFRWLVDRAAAAEFDRADDPTLQEERP